jgi:small subunit ribosomal protein S16
VAVRIRLLRMGKIRNPQYRIVVADSRKKRDGRAIENVGLYHPKEEPSRIEVNSERVQYWLSVGAQPSDPVVAILRKTGDWQKFKGLMPPSQPLKVAAPRADRNAIYEAEAKAAAGLADASSKADKGEKADKAPAKKAAKKAPRKAAAKDADAKDAEAKDKTNTADAAEADAAEAAPTATEQPSAEVASEEQAGAESGERA